MGENDNNNEGGKKPGGLNSTIIMLIIAPFTIWPRTLNNNEFSILKNNLVNSENINAKI